MYEKRSQPPLRRERFLARLLWHLLGAATLLLFSLAIGVWGYVHFEGLSLVDAFLNAAMLLGGMGPVNDPSSVHGKIFAAVFALYAGLVFIVAAAMVLTPVAHRLLHKFHWDTSL